MPNHLNLDSDLLSYIIASGFKPGDRLPTISELQAPDNLGISVSKVREQLEVARALGLVEVRSKTGTRLRPYSFTPPVRLSLFYALANDLHYFEQFSALRTHLEVAFWNEACARLTNDDKMQLHAILEAAQAKLNDQRIRIPSEEHRAFHLGIFKRLENPFVLGLLEAYWDAYEAVELSHYADYAYHKTVWEYHERILAAICMGDFEAAKTAFIEHTRLLRHQPRMQDLDSAIEVTNKVTE
ncbi:MAG TPA: FCD domain-containing protein [Phototrophicaceae bacterium]|nr:FCD domain-containing protein [Phototrophicaceae bacterium]